MKKLILRKVVIFCLSYQSIQQIKIVEWMQFFEYARNIYIPTLTNLSYIAVKVYSSFKYIWTQQSKIDFCVLSVTMPLKMLNQVKSEHQDGSILSRAFFINLLSTHLWKGEKLANPMSGLKAKNFLGSLPSNRLHFV